MCNWRLDKFIVIFWLQSKYSLFNVESLARRGSLNFFCCSLKLTVNNHRTIIESISISTLNFDFISLCICEKMPVVVILLLLKCLMINTDRLNYPIIACPMLLFTVWQPCSAWGCLVRGPNIHSFSLHFFPELSSRICCNHFRGKENLF